MADHVYRVIEVVGSSEEGIDAALRNGLSRVAQTTRNLDWFEVTEIRGHLENDEIAHIQVGMKVGFRVEEPQEQG